MSERVALVRRPSRRMAEGIVTHIGRATVDVDRAVAQHAAYVAALARTGWTIHEVPLGRVLHLKSAVTGLPDGTLIAHDAALVDAAPLPTLRLVPEQGGCHVVLVGDGAVLMAASAPRSAELLHDLGFDVVTVEIGEFEKMEGCMTCLSVLVVRT